MRTFCRSPEWPCARSMASAVPIMNWQPAAPPLPTQKARSMPRGYITLRIIAANIPGPGRGQTIAGNSGSTEGLKASSAVYTKVAPCINKYDAFLIMSKLQSVYPASPVVGSTDDAKLPSRKSATVTACSAPRHVARVAHPFASASESDVRTVHVATSCGAAFKSIACQNGCEAPEMTKTSACGGSRSTIHATCASAAVQICSAGSTGGPGSRKGAALSLAATPDRALAPVFDKKTNGMRAPTSRSYSDVAPGRRPSGE
mmetsp:Transcript_14519/g.45397  ORF Transcript_14519/g.45397 Transcript_14519/m.45397 type:complete len:259 (+) Transcript_14519:177-953(+)